MSEQRLLDFRTVFGDAAGLRVLADLIAFAGREIANAEVRCGRNDVIAYIVRLTLPAPEPVTVRRDGDEGTNGR